MRDIILQAMNKKLHLVGGYLSPQEIRRCNALEVACTTWRVYRV